MAIGEAACVSVHGANRLGSNSLIDLVVFGRAAGQRAADTTKPNAKQAPLPKDAGIEALQRLDKFRYSDGQTSTSELRSDMQRIMQNNCAVFREGDVLQEGQELINKTWNGLDDIKINDRSLVWNTDLIEAMEWDNLIVQSVVTVESAANRKESRGSHAREDFTERDDKNWMKHTLAWIDNENRTTTIDYRPVHEYTLSNEVAYIPPKERVY